jgi:pimeloyl-ACP methyl ester carboxylesterase/DNA-binding transcriptional MerR regulator
VALMGIGEFARLSRISPKALRRYDELGVLPPSRVDPASGYRWYSAGQLDQARLVAALRQIGVPLAQIKVIVPLAPAAAADQIDAYWSGAEADHAARRELACYLVERLNGRSPVMYEVSVRDVPARSLLSMLRYVRQDEFPTVARGFSGRFANESVPRLAGAGGASFVVYHGEVSEDSDGPVEWCRPVPDEQGVALAARFPELTLRTEPAHQEAFVHLARDPARTPAAQSLIIAETLLAWAVEQHRRPNGSVRQIFVSPLSPAGPRLECDFAIPLAGPDRPAEPPKPEVPGLADTEPAASGFAEAEGTDLYFERRGDGPPLLMITGGGGDCAYYSAVADLLANDYTVVTYDRRGNSRSRLHGAPAPITMAQQSADAVAVLRACGFAAAAVFGNSGGATIALDLATRYPQVTRTVIAHEPPIPRILPDAAGYLAIFDEIEQVLRAQGRQAAFTVFLTRIAHLPPDRPELIAALLDPAQVLPPGPTLEVLKRVSGNWEYLMRYEMRPFVDYVPDLGQLAASGVRVVSAVGSESDEINHRMCTVLAARLSAELAEFPGGHDAPEEIPADFAAALRPLLARP